MIPAEKHRKDITISSPLESVMVERVTVMFTRLDQLVQHGKSRSAGRIRKLNKNKRRGAVWVSSFIRALGAKGRIEA